MSCQDSLKGIVQRSFQNQVTNGKRLVDRGLAQEKSVPTSVVRAMSQDIVHYATPKKETTKLLVTSPEDFQIEITCERYKFGQFGW
eukprot:444059-Amphidinium_carterae.1